MKRTIRSLLALLIVVGTIGAFIWYIRHNPAIIEQLKQTPPLAMTAIVLLHAGGLVALMGVLYASLRMYGKRMSANENFSLNAYSSLINFFGPGQSGPGFRAAYLKIKHSLKIKQYLFATLIYYAFYAIISGILLVASARPWWQTVLLTIVIIACCVLVLRIFVQRNKSSLDGGASKSQLITPVVIIAGATAFQIICLCLAYFVGLNAVSENISIGQTLTYTGAANFALFVAITPGAIGFREAFLLFSQNLHNIPSDIIVAANVLDRAAYIIFLGLIFLITLGMHTSKRLQVNKIKKLEAAN